MALQRFVIRGADDWLLFGARLDAPDDDRVYVTSTELWPEWTLYPAAADQEHGAVMRYMAAHATDAHFGLPTWLRCDACGEWPRYAGPEGIRSVCGCPVDSYGEPVLDPFVDALLCEAGR